MAQADLPIDIVRTGAQANQELFRRSLEALITEERSNQHHVLADQHQPTTDQQPAQQAGVPLLQTTMQHRSELARGIKCKLIFFSWAMKALSRNDRWPPCINRNSGWAARFRQGKDSDSGEACKCNFGHPIRRSKSPRQGKPNSPLRRLLAQFWLGIFTQLVLWRVWEDEYEDEDEKDVVARPDVPLVEPHPQAGRAQSLRQLAQPLRQFRKA